MALPKSLHPEFRKQIGLLEYRYGNSERAKTIFENLIAEYPKKADIWNVFIDAESKHRKRFPGEIFD
jgi:rRNA biogenesis protein RRP5